MDSKKMIPVLLVLVIIGAIGLTACTTNGGGTTTSNPPFTTVASTAQLYADQCAFCHGANREGGLGPDIRWNSDTIKSFSSATALYDRISDHYPAQDLGPDAQRQLAAYLFQESH